MTTPLWCLLGFVAWTIVLLLAIALTRVGAVLTGAKKANEFPSGVPHGGDLACRCPPDDDRQPEEDGAFESSRAEFSAGAGRVPKPEQRRTFGWLNFCDLVQGVGSRGRLDYIFRKKLGQARCVDRKKMRRL